MTVIEEFLTDAGYRAQPEASALWGPLKQTYLEWLSEHGLTMRVAALRQALIDMGYVIGRGQDNLTRVGGLAEPGAEPSCWVLTPRGRIKLQPRFPEQEPRVSPVA